MKKTTSFLLALCFIIGLAAPSAQAASSNATSAQQIVQALGIVTGDEAGNLNLTGNVTRAEFAKMMIAASIYKDTISSTAKSSPFKDVKYTHWAASYVQAAVTAGWLTGYTDGTYKPDNNVKLEEAVSAVLKMLGYAASDFSGSFPEAQLAKYSALGLNTNISKTQGQILTRQDCINLFYNLMRTKTKAGSYYATTLGYTVNSSGELDYSSLVLNNMKGPFIVEDSSWAASLPFSASTATVYKNGSVSKVSDVSNYDVYYYNSSIRTIWVYSNSVTGVYTAASPSTAAPTSVTVAGKSYEISTSTATFELSDMGSFGIGDTVTLLLGKNGDVVGVTSAKDSFVTKYGIVLSSGTSTYTDSTGTRNSVDTINVVCTDGNTYQYEYKNYSGGTGALVEISFVNGKASISFLSKKTIYGAVNSSATALGTHLFSADIQILDVSISGSYIRIYPSRLAGLTINVDDVKYYVLDSSGNISRLILNNVTNDMCKPAVLTNQTTSYGEIFSTANYYYTLDGVPSSYLNCTTFYPITYGPILLEFNGSSIVNMKPLTSVLLTSLSSAYAWASDVKYPLGDNACVYIYKDRSYSLSTISAVSSGGYTLYGYYDKATVNGGRIRVIVANAN